MDLWRLRHKIVLDLWKNYHNIFIPCFLSKIHLLWGGAVFPHAAGRCGASPRACVVPSAEWRSTSTGQETPEHVQPLPQTLTPSWWEELFVLNHEVAPTFRASFWQFCVCWNLQPTRVQSVCLQHWKSTALQGFCCSINISFNIQVVLLLINAAQIKTADLNYTSCF